MGKCNDGRCSLLDSQVEVCCFECDRRNICKLTCDYYDEDKDYEYTECDEYRTDEIKPDTDMKSQIIRDYANKIYIEFCEMQMIEEKITLKDIAEVLKIDFKEGDS